MRRLSLLLLLLQTVTVFSQETGLPIEYNGGKKLFYKNFSNYLNQHNAVYGDPTKSDSLRKFNKFFTVLMEIDKAGVVISDVFITACNDTSVVAVLAAAVRETSGKWINHTGASRWVQLPIWYFYDDGSTAVEKAPVLESFRYSGNGKTSIVYLEPFIITLYPRVS